MKKKRNRLEIIHDLMKVMDQNRNAGKTRIMQDANLDWRNFKRYFSFLINKGYIVKFNNDSYKITEKGSMLSQRLKPLDELDIVDMMLDERS